MIYVGDFEVLEDSVGNFYVNCTALKHTGNSYIGTAHKLGGRYTVQATNGDLLSFADTLLEACEYLYEERLAKLELELA